MQTASQVRWTKTLHLGLLASLEWGLHTARALLPRSIKRHLARFAPVAEAALTTSVQLRFETRSIALADWPALLPADTFADGPIVLANNGLAPGGVERQIVNTLLGLQSRQRAAGLLCLRLHDDPEFDFFLPALAGFHGFIRNIMPRQRADAALAAAISEPAAVRLRQAVSWMPSDVQDEVLRFAAEFALLKPAVVHAWQDATNISAGYAARLVGVPQILVSSRNLVPTNFDYFRSYMLPGYRELASCCSIVMINNSEAGARDYSRWLGVPFERFVVKRNGIDTRTMRRPTRAEAADLRRRLGIPEGARVVGSIYRFYPEKRPLLWIETAARVARECPDCHFVIFGEGPLQRHARRTAKDHGFSVRLHCPGNIADSALGISLLDVFLLTSKFEGTPNVVLEASLLGVPVVGTDAGGTREAIAVGSTGLLAASSESESLAGLVLTILNDPDWAERARHAGPAFVEERFGLARMLDETLKLYGVPVP